MDQRGIIVIPTLANWRRVDPEFLRMCVLYWDIIDFPGTRGPGIRTQVFSDDLAFLEKAGLVKRTLGHFFIRENDSTKFSSLVERPREFWTTAQFHALRKYHRLGEDWSIGQPSKSLLFPVADATHYIFAEGGNPQDISLIPSAALMSSKDLVSWTSSSNLVLEDAVVSLEFRNAIPVPTSETPIETILEFKARRKDELSDFRLKMDELILEIASAGWIPRAKTHAIAEVERALEDLHKVMKEQRIRNIRPSLKTEINLIDVAKNALTVAASANVLTSGFELDTVAAILGAVGGAVLSQIEITFDPKRFKPKGIPGYLKSYAYLYHIEKELMGK